MASEAKTGERDRLAAGAGGAPRTMAIGGRRGAASASSTSTALWHRRHAPGERPRALVRMRLRLHQLPGAGSRRTVPANEPSRPPRESDQCTSSSSGVAGWARPWPATSIDGATRWPSSTSGRGLQPPAGATSAGRPSPASASTATACSRPGIEQAGAVAAVTNGDNSNILVARVARETFGIERVVARIYDPRRAAIYQRLGIPTVATVAWTTERVLRRILPDEAGGRVDRPERPGVAGRADRSPAPGPGHPLVRARGAGRGPGRRRSAASAWPSPARRPRRPGGRRASTSPWPATRSTPSTRLPGRRTGQGRALMRVVIAGGGSVGRFIAEQLHEAGHEVLIIDNDPAVVRSAERVQRARRASPGSRPTPARSRSWPRPRSTRPTSSPPSPATTRTTS